MRYLAIDYGKKRIGLALCDPSETIVSPFGVVTGRKNLLPTIAGIIEEHHVKALVIGLPVNMDGSIGPQAEIAKKFAEKISRHLDIPIHLQDERLTTFAAEQQLAPAQLSAKKQKQRIDAVAAAEILQAFLDKKTENSAREDEEGE